MKKFKKVLYSMAVVIFSLNLTACTACGGVKNTATENSSTVTTESKQAYATSNEADNYAKDNKITGTLTLEDGTVLTYNEGVRVEDVVKEDETAGSENSNGETEAGSVEAESSNTSNETESSNGESTPNNTDNTNIESKKAETTTQAPVTNVTDVAAYIKKTYGATYYKTEAESKEALRSAVYNNAETIHIAWSGTNALTNWLKSEPIYSDVYADYVLRQAATSYNTYTINGSKVYSANLNIRGFNGTSAQQTEARQIVKKFANTLRGKSVYEQILEAYKWTYEIAKYDEAKSVHSGQSIYSAVVAKKTVCAGYAKTFQMIMEELGIPCKIITGESTKTGIITSKNYIPNSTSNRAGHAWNLIQFNNAWYYVDTTKAVSMNDATNDSIIYSNKLLAGKDWLTYTKLESILNIVISETSYNKEEFAGWDADNSINDNYTGVMEISGYTFYYYNGVRMSKDEYYNKISSGSSSNTSSEESSTQYDEEYVKSFLDARAQESNHTGRMTMGGITLYYINGVRVTEEQYNNR